MNRFCTRTYLGAVSALMALGLTAGQAHAALDAGVTTAMGDTKADVAALGALALVVVIAIAGFRYLKKAP